MRPSSSRPRQTTPASWLYRIFFASCLVCAFILPLADPAYIAIQVLYAALGAYALTCALSSRHLDLDFALIGILCSLFSLACIAVYPQDRSILAMTIFMAAAGFIVPMLRAASQIASGRLHGHTAKPSAGFSVILHR